MNEYFSMIGWIVAIYFAYNAGKSGAERDCILWQTEALDVLEKYHSTKEDGDYRQLLEKFKEYP